MKPEPSDHELLYQLSLRMGANHARQRLGIERECEGRVLGTRQKFFHIENWHSVHGLIRGCLRLVGLLNRGQWNARQIKLRHHRFGLPHLPSAFEGFRILHLSDLHVDMDPLALNALIERLTGVDYDLCVLTGDYRKKTWGSIDGAMDGMRELRRHLRGEIYAVLGNHDSIRMVPELEAMGYRLLLNENQAIEREGQQIFIAGVDDAHFYRVDNLEKAAEGLPNDIPRLLLCHTPELFRQSAHAGFDVFLCGHTHGGQICLPGGIALTLDADCPRAIGKGAWQHQGMQGYTSVGAGTSIVNVRLNCPPEITVHTLVRTAASRDDGEYPRKTAAEKSTFQIGRTPIPP
jgi:uncharacterized protein